MKKLLLFFFLGMAVTACTNGNANQNVTNNDSIAEDSVLMDSIFADTVNFN